MWKFSHTLLVPEMVTRDTIGQLGRRPATHYGGQLMKVTIPAVSGVGKVCSDQKMREREKESERERKRGERE